MMRGTALALALALAWCPSAGWAVDEDTVGWWIYAGSVRGTLVARTLGPEGITPETAAIARAGRGCRLPVRIERLSGFRETPLGDEPVVFGPFLDRGRAAAALACVGRYVPGAVLTQARPPD